MPLIETRGALTSRAYGEFSAPSVVPSYIEDVFSTYLYTSDFPAVAKTITNGVNLSSNGGMVWIKCRSHNLGASSHVLVDTARGAQKVLSINNGSEVTDSQSLTAFNSTGFSIGTQVQINAGYGSYVSWTFRNQPKFFDVVTYTGNATLRDVSHSLGSVPGAIFIHARNASGSGWLVYHRSVGTQNFMVLNTTDAQASSSNWMPTAPTSTTFPLSAALANSAATTYVAYLFAHDAGGFGAAGTDNVISCGSFTTDGSGNATVTLGWEPQWIMRKSSSSTATGWEIGDNMRGLLAPPSGSPFLTANTALAESSLGTRVFGPTATGFTAVGSPSTTYIYIAIRRGPMRTPTSGTSVYSNLAYTGDQTDNRILSQGSSAPNDLFMFMDRTNGAGTFSSNGLGSPVYDRLRGISVSNTSASKTAPALGTQFTNAETGVYAFTLADTQTNFSVSGNLGALNTSAVEMAVQMFRRAPGFFDVVCWTGDGVHPRNISHNLGVAPEVIITKNQGGTTPSIVDWIVGSNYLISSGTSFQPVARLNTTDAAFNNNAYFAGDPTATTFSVTTHRNSAGTTYVGYLFASCPGVSKVGFYTGTGTGTTQQINCGFTGGARFVLIKRASLTGNWYVWDTARGLVAGNDPYIRLNSINPETTGTDYIDPLSSGFEISSTAPAEINSSGARFFYIAIA